jgi:hypothetical protein
MKKFKFILILAVMIFSANSFGQSTCETAVLINPTDSVNQAVIPVNDTAYWLKFVATDTSVYMGMKYITYDTSYQNQITMYHSTNNCTAYTLIAQSTDGIYLHYGNLNIGNTYFIKLKNNGKPLKSNVFIFYKGNDKASNLPNTNLLNLSYNQTVCLGTQIAFDPPLDNSGAVFYGLVFSGANSWDVSGFIIGVSFDCPYPNPIPYWVSINAINSYGSSSTIYTGYVTMQPEFTNTIDCSNVDFFGTTCITNPAFAAYCTYQWNYGNGNVSAISSNPNITYTYPASGTYNVTLSIFYNNPVINCNQIQQISHTITINPIPTSSTLTIAGQNNDCGNEAYYNIQNPTTCTNYNWTLSQGGSIESGQGTSTIRIKFNHTISNCNKAILTVVATNNQGYSATASFEIYPCCTDHADYVFNNYTTTSNLSIPTGSSVIINGDFIMEHNVSFDNANVYVSPNSKIKLNNTTISLSITNFTTITSTIDCCIDMWDGIYTSDITQDVDIISSTITNAQHALNVYQGSSFMVEYSDFINNYKNIYIYQGSGGGTPAYPGIIRGCNFIGNNSLPHHPYQGMQTYSGVEVFRTNLLTIGDPSSASYTNNFESMFCGIKTEQSLVNIYNNQFTNINSSLQSPGFDPTQIYNATAIFSIGDPVLNIGINLWQGTKIGGSGLYSNDLKNCYNGIYAYNLLLQVDENSLNTTHFGVEGRDLYDNSYVRNNTIAGAISATDHTREGIRISNIQPRRCKLRVYSNTINAINRGIMITNAYTDAANSMYVEVYSNTINLNGNNPPAGKPYSAIKADNCNGISINNNNLSIANYAAAVDNLFYGIDIAQTPNAFITNNPNINKYGAGINVFGNCNITQFYCNVLNQCYNGFLFNNQSSITNQGISDVINTDNDWVGNYNFGTTTRKLWAEPTNLITPYTVRWFVQNSPPTSMQIQNSNNQNPTYNKIAQFENNTNAQSSCMALPTPASMAAGEREEMYGKIVRDSNAYTALQEQYKTYDREVLYKALKENPMLMNLGDATDALYQDFYAEEAAGNIEKIDAIEEFIKNNEDSLAMLKNAELQDQKQIDYFRKQVNEIYLTTFAKGNYNLSQEQIDILLPIATQYTPWEGGDAVYIARLMLNIDEEKIEVDYAKVPKAEAKSTITNNARLYPNPASTEVMIEFDNKLSSSAVFEIYNFEGLKIIDISLNKGYQFISVSTKDLKAGLYMYRISDNEKIIAKDKLLIVK